MTQKQDFTVDEWSELLKKRRQEVAARERVVSKFVSARKKRERLRNLFDRGLTLLSFFVLILICIGVWK